MKIVLGVIEVAYTNDRKDTTKSLRSLRGKKSRKTAEESAATQTKNTGDVAEILEAKYHIMEIFAHLHEADIVKSLEETLTDNFEDLLSSRLGTGGETVIVSRGPGSNSMLAATSQIETTFRRFIDAQEMDGIQPGVPTLASLLGINHRLKHPYSSSNPVRPSFRDTGLYMQSFKCEIRE